MNCVIECLFDELCDFVFGFTFVLLSAIFALVWLMIESTFIMLKGNRWKFVNENSIAIVSLAVALIGS